MFFEKQGHEVVLHDINQGSCQLRGGQAAGGNLRPLTQDPLPPECHSSSVTRATSKPRHLGDSRLVGLKPKLGQVKKACPALPHPSLQEYRLP